MSATGERLWEYALGTLTPAERAEVERELEASPELGRELTAIQEAMSVLPVGLAPIAPGASVRARLLDSLQGVERFAPFFGRVAALIDVGVDKVREILAKIDDPASWEPLYLPGMDAIHLHGGPALAGADAGIVRVPPGFSFPRHRHLGDEVEMVLQGAYRDTLDGRVVGPGEPSRRPAGSVHSYSVEPGEVCVYVTVLFTGQEFVGS